jgi:sugar transferase EpsL
MEDGHPDHTMRNSRAYDLGKRLIDFFLAIAAGLVCAPFAALAAAMLWFVQGRVLFRQVRPGLYGKPFILYKFCTMSEEKDESGRLLPDSHRITPIGRIIRSLSIDELPQLWNVIRGDMSLVGPRPLLMEYLARYSSEQARRHDVKPGITGWAQVNGRNSLSWDEKFELDIWYVEHRSFFLDMKILTLTAFRVVERHGISNQQHATMPEFLGSLQGPPSHKDALINPPHPELPEVR